MRGVCYMKTQIKRESAKLKTSLKIGKKSR